MLQMDFPWQRPILPLPGRRNRIARREIATACGAQTAAIGLAEHHKRRVHDDRVVDGLTQIDDAVLTQELVAVLVGSGSSGSSKR